MGRKRGEVLVGRCSPSRESRGVEDVFIVVCDGLKGGRGRPDTTWEHTVVQQCIVYLVGNSFRYIGRQHRDAIVESLCPDRHRLVRVSREGPV